MLSDVYIWINTKTLNYIIICRFHLVAAWLDKQKVDPEYLGYKGRNVSLECPAKGFPLQVEWKFKKKGEDKVRSCIGMFSSHFALNWKQALHHFGQFYFIEIS